MLCGDYGMLGCLKLLGSAGSFRSDAPALVSIIKDPWFVRIMYMVHERLAPAALL